MILKLIPTLLRILQTQIKWNTQKNNFVPLWTYSKPPWDGLNGKIIFTSKSLASDDLMRCSIFRSHIDHTYKRAPQWWHLRHDSSVDRRLQIYNVNTQNDLRLYDNILLARCSPLFLEFFRTVEDDDRQRGCPARRSQRITEPVNATVKDRKWWLSVEPWADR